MVEASAGVGSRTRAAVEQYAFRVAVPRVLPEVSLVQVMEGSVFAPDLRSIVRAREGLGAFVRRVDVCLTDLLISPHGKMPLLREAMETAVRAHNVTGQLDRRAEAARFMAACLSVMASGLLGYNVWGLSAGHRQQWRPLEDGPLREFLGKHSFDELGFELKHPPLQAHKAAMRFVVARWACTFEDLVSMEHCGIDYRSFEV